jgi:hypothetical protein
MFRLRASSMRDAVREQSRASEQTTPGNSEHHYLGFRYLGKECPHVGVV